jgi:hypothetical protein
MGFVTSYNQTTMIGVRESSVLNNRLNIGYNFLNKQNFACSFLYQARNVKNRTSANDLVATVGYNYYF